MEREKEIGREEFLAFLDQAMLAEPARLRPFTASDVEGLDELLAEVEVDPDEDLGDFVLP
jgi:hypothetical protein